MRAVLLIIAFLAVTNAIAPVKLNGTLLDLDDYFNGLWSYFNLNQSEAIECFDGVSAESYFEYMAAGYNLAGAFAAGNHQAVQQYVALVVGLNVTLYPTMQCLIATQDYNDLEIAAGVNTFNKTLVALLNQLYNEAHLGDYYQAWTPIYNLLNNGTYNAAGVAYGPIYVQINQNSTSQLIYYLQSKAIQNGVFFYYNLTQPTQLSACYNETQAQSDFDLLWNWAVVVNNSTLLNVVNNTNSYFAGIGGQTLLTLKPVWQCEDATQDQANLNQAAGIDVHSQQFTQAISTYIASNVVTYYLLFTEIYTALNSYNPEAAGILYGQFINVVANSVSL